MDSGSKVAVVTGASRGIGAGTVTAFLERGWRVVATSRSLKPSGRDDVLSIAGDIGDPEVGRRVVSECVARFGRIDTLVNNAGIFLAKPFTSYTPEDYRAVLSTNVDGFFHITQLALAEMEKRGGGHIVNITASLVDAPTSKMPAALAALTKGGLNAVTRSLALEYASRGIRVNAVAPGVTNTPLHPVERHEALAKMHPLGRIGEVADITGAILYLEEASFITGEILRVDGGRNLGQ